MNFTERTKFSVPINDALSVMNDASDSLYIKGEFLGYFVNRVAKKFLGDPEYVNSSFNSTFFNESKKKTLTNAADSVAAVLNRADPIGVADQCHYALHTLIQGFMGSAEGFAPPTRGLAYYVKGILHKVLESIRTINTGSQKDMTMTFRRHLVICGIVNDIMDQIKISSTASESPLWYEGKINLDESLDIYTQTEKGATYAPAKAD